LTAQVNVQYERHFNKSTELFDVVHSNVWGNSLVDSKEGFKYFATFIDDKSQATWLYLLKSKNEVLTVFQYFCSMAKNQFNITVKVI